MCPACHIVWWKADIRASVQPQPWPNSTPPRMTSNENTSAAVHTFVSMVASLELQQLATIRRRILVTATFLSTARGSEAQPG